MLVNANLMEFLIVAGSLVEDHTKLTTTKLRVVVQEGNQKSSVPNTLTLTYNYLIHHELFRLYKAMASQIAFPNYVICKAFI